MADGGFYIGIDIGAGLGAKIGLFADPHHQMCEELLTVEDFGGDIDVMV